MNVLCRATEERIQETELLTFYGEVVDPSNKELMIKICENIKLEGTPMSVNATRKVLSMLAVLYLKEHTEA